MKGILAFLSALAVTSTAAAQGWALSRTTLAPAGDRSLIAQDPWYDGATPVAAALTLDYTNLPLRLDRPDATQRVIVEHMLQGHVQASVAFLDRFNVALSLPVALYEGGADEPVYGLRAGSANLGDVGLAVRGRIFGSAATDPFSLHATAELYLPLVPIASQRDWVTDGGARFRGGLVAAGTIDVVRWSVSLAYHVRPTIRTPVGTSDDDISGTAGVTVVTVPGLLDLGVELFVLGVPETGDFGGEGLVVGHLTPHENVRISLAAGPGFGPATGIPSAQTLLRVAYVPSPPRSTADADHDGVDDADDECPRESAGEVGDPSRAGCPDRDSDEDGIPNSVDPCPEAPPGPNPDPSELGCPLIDADADGIPDRLDPCPEEAPGPNADPSRAGCPSFEGSVAEGNPERLVPCAEGASGPNVDPSGQGCPQFDVDGDGIPNDEDQCSGEAVGPYADPGRAGCPAPDRDHDQVPDDVDRCPDNAGAPHPSPERNGCPGLVAMDRDQLRISRPIYFGTDSDEILRRSYPVLQAVADALVASPHVQRIVIEGHTDDQGDADHNLELSQRRAEAVARWLTEHGVEASRLVARGFGESRPIVSNDTPEGRAENRRVEFNLNPRGE